MIVRNLIVAMLVSGALLAPVYAQKKKPAAPVVPVTPKSSVPPAPPDERPRVRLSADNDGEGMRRTRLYLKDGSYQTVLNYRVQGANVFYLSADRAGETEVIPLSLVDMAATERWKTSHDPTARAVVLSAELAAEEADRAEHTPEVATNLRLPDSDSVLALDVYQGQSQLAVLQQSDGELNRQTAHNILRQTINPLAHAKQLVELKGTTAAVQMHVPDPVIYVRLDGDTGDEPVHSGALRVDTGGNGAGKDKGPEQTSAKSEYVIVRVDVRRDLRVVTSFSVSLLGSTKRQSDVIETTKTVMPGGHWLKIAPKEQLAFGEYALVEVLDGKNVNLGVWDFGVRPSAGPNRDAIVPEVRSAPKLEIRDRTNRDR